jgi:hypothetical protein
MPKPSAKASLFAWPIEMLRVVVEREEAERLSSLSWDTLRRRYPDKIVQLSERRKGIRVGHCLMLADKE